MEKFNAAMTSINKITLADAVKFTENYRNAHPGATSAFTTRFDEIQTLINDIKSHTGININHIRIYMAINHNNEETLVLVGVDSFGKDICSFSTAAGQVSGTYDMMLPCPNTCDTSSPLNDISMLDSNT